MKKILAFTLALAMVLSSATMTFAASKEVEALANLKLLLNTTDAEVNADLNRAVGLAMVLKALGYTQEDANAKMAENTFVDMEKYGWAKGFTVLGEELKITNGTSVEPKMFSPSAKLNERAFVAFLLRALGHDVDAAWAKAGELAKENSLTETVSENKLTKGEAAVIMYNALKAKVVGDEKGRTLAEKLVADKKLDKELAVANGLISGEPEKLTVTAMAENLREVTVTFDGTVDKETAKKEGNYKIKGYSVEKANVQEDGKTVVLKIGKALANKKELELTVSGVKNVAGVMMEKQTVKFSTNDVTAPKVESVVVTGPSNLEVTFSEPMNPSYIPFVKLQSGKSSLQVKNSMLKYNEKGNERVLQVEVYGSMKDGVEYLLMIGDGKNNSSYPRDYANYTASYYEESFTYAKDTTAPEVKVVEADQEKVVLEFTKPVKGFNEKNFYHTFSSYHPLEVNTEDNKKVELVFYKESDKEKSRALPAGEVKLSVLGKVGSKKVEDNWGNQLADTELVLSISADREAPQVASVEVKGKKTVEVVFSEEITYGGNSKKEFTIQLLDKDGKVVEKNETITSQNKENKTKVFEFTFKNEYVGKTMTLVLKEVKDKSLYKNVMADYSTELVFGDKELVFSDKIKAEYQIKPIDSNDNFEYFLFVTFEEEMDDTALENANYKLRKAGKEQAPKGSAEFFDGNRKIVVFELTAGENSDVLFLTGQQKPNVAQFGAVNNTNVVLSNKIKDLAGNINDSFEFVLTAKNITSTPFEVKEVKAVAVDKIEIVMKAPIANLDSDVDHYGVTTTDNKKREVSGVEFKEDKIIVLTLKQEMKYNESNVLQENESSFLLPGNPEQDAVQAKVEFKAGNELMDAFGRKVTTGEKHKVLDKIAPAIAVVSKTADGQAGVEAAYTNLKTNEDSLKGVPAILVKALDKNRADVKIKLTEEIEPTSLSTQIFTVSNGYSVQTASVTTSEVTLRIQKDDGSFDDLKDLTVSQKATLLDKNGNKTASANLNVEMPTMYVEKLAPVLTYTVVKEFKELDVENTYEGELKITIENGKFAVGLASAATAFTVSGNSTFDATDLSIQRVSDTELKVTLTGNVIEHEAGVKTLKLAFKAEAFEDPETKSQFNDILNKEITLNVTFK